MSDVKTLAHARGLGAAGRPRRPREETARLGDEIYERDIRSKVEETRHGKIVAIDVDSRDYAIGDGISDASDRLRAEHPSPVRAGRVQVCASLWGQFPAENRVIGGSANANYEAAVTLPLPGPYGQERDIEAVVDTGFLTLSLSFVEELGLAYLGNVRAELANGSKDDFDVYGFTVLWDDQPRYVPADEADATPLLGMALMDSYDLNIDVENGAASSYRPRVVRPHNPTVRNSAGLLRQAGA